MSARWFVSAALLALHLLPVEAKADEPGALLREAARYTASGDCVAAAQVLRALPDGPLTDDASGAAVEAARCAGDLVLGAKVLAYAPPEWLAAVQIGSFSEGEPRGELSLGELDLGALGGSRGPKRSSQLQAASGSRASAPRCRRRIERSASSWAAG